jgi:hypothetical protein
MRSIPPPPVPDRSARTMTDRARDPLCRILACGSLLALAGCVVPLPTQSVLASAPEPFGRQSLVPHTAASPGGMPAAGADQIARSAAGAETTRGYPVELPVPAVCATSGGRFHIAADPTLVWTVPEPQDPQQPAPQHEDDSRWSDFLPFGRQAVLEAGYDLPRAFGIGVAYTRLRRDIAVTEVRTGLNGAPPERVDFLSVEADSVVDNVMARLDAWILPFWNVSLLGGWTWNESHSQITVDIPLPVNPQQVTFQVPTHQEGPTWGVGTNLSGGYREWFISGDGTWIQADMSDFSRIEGFLGSVRSGWNGKIEGKPVRLWGGFTWWDTDTTVKGSAATPAGPLAFSVDQGPVTPWSLQVGGNVEFDRAHGIMLELHKYHDVQMLVVSAAIRF